MKNPLLICCCLAPQGRFGSTCRAAILLAGVLAGAGQAAAAPEPVGAFAGELRAFAEQDARQPPPAGVVLFVGSSSIRLWDVQQSFPDAPVLNRGFGGSQISDVLENFDRVIGAYKPRTIIFYSGDNDAAAGKSAEQIGQDYAELVRRVHASQPGVPLVVISTKPSIQRWKLIETIRDANRRIAAIAKEDSLVHYVDVHPPMLNEKGEPRPELFRADGLHMNDEGYKIWTKLVAPWVKPQ